MMVETRKHIAYPMMYLLLKLALPVAIATVERSSMNFVKNQMCNRDIFDSIENENILQRFQNMTSRRGQL